MFQAASNRVVDMKLRLESGRLLLYRACDALDLPHACLTWGLAGFDVASGISP